MTVLAIQSYPTNAELIYAVAKLGYIRPDDRVIDVTYGRGTWWKRYRPANFVTNDLGKGHPKIRFDFRRAPFPDGAFDVVAYDPPYKLCLDDQTEILTRRGWLSCDEVLVGDHAYSMTKEGKGCWSNIDDVHIYPASPTAVSVCRGKNLDFVATPCHRWLVRTAGGSWIWRTTDNLKKGDRIPQGAPRSDAPAEAILSDALVELIAWFWTEGYLDRPSTYGHITQSHAVNPQLCDRIAKSFEKEFGPPMDQFERAGRSSVPAWRIRDEERNRRFIFSSSVGATFEQHAPNKVPTLDFLESLTAEQLDLFIEVSLLGDGQSPNVLAQARSDQAEAFALACILAGRPISFIYRNDGNGFVTHLKERGFSKPYRPGVATESRFVRVWCPTIAKTGVWLARRNGRIYFTGNSGTPALGDFDDRFGVEVPTRWQDRHKLIGEGLDECARLTRKYVLMKCQDQVSSGHVRWQTFEFVRRAEMDLGLHLEDMLHKLGGREQPKDRRQVHARRNYSTLLVFKKTPR
jgi:hypothetical protein